MHHFGTIDISVECHEFRIILGLFAKYLNIIAIVVLALTLTFSCVLDAVGLFFGKNTRFYVCKRIEA
jgi:hypothetical protein